MEQGDETLKDIFNREIEVGDQVLALCNRGTLKPITVLGVVDKRKSYYGSIGLVAETEAEYYNWTPRDGDRDFVVKHYKTKRIYSGPFYKLEEGYEGFVNREK